MKANFIAYIFLLAMVSSCGSHKDEDLRKKDAQNSHSDDQQKAGDAPPPQIPNFPIDPSTGGQTGGGSTGGGSTTPQGECQKDLTLISTVNPGNEEALENFLYAKITTSCVEKYNWVKIKVLTEHPLILKAPLACKALTEGASVVCNGKVENLVTEGIIKIPVDLHQEFDPAQLKASVEFYFK